LGRLLNCSAYYTVEPTPRCSCARGVTNPALIFAVIMCLSVTNRSSIKMTERIELFWHSRYPRLIYIASEGNSGISKIRVLPCGTSSQTLNLADLSVFFSTARRSSHVINLQTLTNISFIPVRFFRLVTLCQRRRFVLRFLAFYEYVHVCMPCLARQASMVLFR